MIPVSDLEMTMAINNTFASILNEIQLSNLNFSVQITPFAAYITLKKSALKDLNGHHVLPSPPLLSLLQSVHQENLSLRDQNETLKTALGSLEKKFTDIAIENASLVDAIKDASNSISALTNDNENLKSRMDTANQEKAKFSVEKASSESKIKELKKSNADQVRKLETQVADLNKSSKTQEKVIYDLNKKLENVRDTLKNRNSEKSLLKINKTKLEATVNKLNKQLEKNMKSVVKVTADSNGNDTIVTTPGSSDNSSFNTCSIVSPSMMSHWNPNSPKILQSPHSIPSMIAHCAPKEKLITREEFLSLMAEFREQMRNDRIKMLAEIKKSSLFVSKE